MNVQDLHTQIDSNLKTLWIINHSGGKDSQAMYLHLTDNLDVPSKDIVVIHAELHGMDWEGTVDHIEATTWHELITCSANKTFADMVRHRSNTRPDSPSFPSSQYRQCTSDLKRGPISKVIRRLCKDRGYKQVINCIGIRAQESTARSKKQPFKLDTAQTIDSRKVYTYYPIFDWHVTKVWDTIKAAGQKGFYTYDKGMTRKSCVLCIMASKKDLETAAALRPDMVDHIEQLEQETGYTMFQGKTIREMTAPEPTSQLDLF